MDKIVVVNPVKDHHLDQIRAAAPAFELVASDVRFSEQELLHHLEDATVVVGWNAVTASFLRQPNARVRWIQHWGAGVEHLPLADIQARDIVLTNATGVHAAPISETIFAMLLAFTRQLHTAIRSQQERSWGKYGELGELHGRTLGIIGVGAIGEETARIAKAFDMRVLGVRRSGLATPNVDRMYDMPQLHELLSESDFVVNCLPHTAETKHIMDKAAFDAMKDASYYINIGRGATTDTAALLQALTDGKLAGAGLDVFEEEPLPADHPLWQMENVIVTPHNAGSTYRYTDRLIDIFTANLEQYAAGITPSINRVELKLGY
ncbi:phosphoglycerate dehydrogenase-like enzyme [Paenibacillus phyllosphaerae]|uniref:Phosphoglycerate dehydrogenase-like enzyme n=1 Tax=Paenibacillus phyllosphaerae TaxID=274593 RepID=A0A7W5AUC8_9BACL|nr:D-2-hydroxyacid dehydrogenase [Paenibacillus phyllosphaerae]MBB3108950.1 phosphoglycerate dehydrogenase-like enzyme [Paenibacillus phyllosphaerae]